MTIYGHNFMIKLLICSTHHVQSRVLLKGTGICQIEQCWACAKLICMTMASTWREPTGTHCSLVSQMLFSVLAMSTNTAKKHLARETRHTGVTSEFMAEVLRMSQAFNLLEWLDLPYNISYVHVIMCYDH